MVTAPELNARVESSLLARNEIFANFFAREAPRVAEACRAMSTRFLKGGRLLAFGKGPYATDAQHVAVEFVHPVIVGKRALPALDLSPLFGPWLEALATPEDMVMGFGPPDGDAEVARALERAWARGAMTFALPGVTGSYALTPASPDPFVHQELMELLYHVLWESVHVFFERRELGHSVGQAGFLYPFLGQGSGAATDPVEEVTASILLKVGDDAALRARVAGEQAEAIAGLTLGLAERVRQGGKIILFGNGGSATDANDWAIDCVAPPKGYAPVPAVSLSFEPASITAIANDVGTEVIFLRQLIAQARPEDAVVAISTSGGSRNVIAALEAARRRKLFTAALLGYDGGEILRRSLADRSVLVHSDYIPRIQEVQASIYHVIRDGLETIRRDG